MELEITSNTDNALFDRKDVKFVLRHAGEPTPPRNEMRKLVAAEVGTKTENVVIDNMESATGMGATRGLARIYTGADAARSAEREHFLRRNNLYKDPKAAAESDEGGDE